MKKAVVILLLLSMVTLSACRNNSDLDNSSSAPMNIETEISVTSEASEDEAVISDVNEQVSSQNSSVSSVTSSNSSKKNTVSSVPTNTDNPDKSNYPQTDNVLGNFQFSTGTYGKIITFQKQYVYYVKHGATRETNGIFERSLNTGAERQISIYPGSHLNIVGDFLIYRMPVDYWQDFYSSSEQSFVDKANYKIVGVNIKTLEINLLNSGVSDNGLLTAYDIVALKDKIYYIPMHTNKQVRSMNFNGSDNKALLNIGSNQNAFCLTENNLYSATADHRITVSDLNGGNIKNIITLGDVYGAFGIPSDISGSFDKICVDSGYVYFYLTLDANYANANSYNGIYRVKTDGSGVARIAASSRIDYTVISGKLILVSADGKSLEILNGDGSGTAVKIEMSAFSYAFYGNKLYYNTADGMYSINLDGSSKNNVF